MLVYYKKNRKPACYDSDSLLTVVKILPDERPRGPFKSCGNCSNPSHGFICYSSEGDCLKTDMQRICQRKNPLIPGEDLFSKIAPPLQTLKLYMPLTVTQYEQDEWGSWDEYPSELDKETSLAYQDQILAAILRERMPEETERGLMKYYHENDGVNEKVQSLFFTVEQIGDRLMGVAECRVQGDLSNTEIMRLKEYTTGQASDGFGEGFEQRPIKVSDGEIYVSLWNSDKNWSIMTQKELSNSQQMGGLQFG